jgi:hypothetical protein
MFIVGRISQKSTLDENGFKGADGSMLVAWNVELFLSSSISCSTIPIFE